MLPYYLRAVFLQCKHRSKPHYQKHLVSFVIKTKSPFFPKQDIYSMLRYTVRKCSNAEKVTLPQRKAKWWNKGTPAYK